MQAHNQAFKTMPLYQLEQLKECAQGLPPIYDGKTMIRYDFIVKDLIILIQELQDAFHEVTGSDYRQADLYKCNMDEDLWLDLKEQRLLQRKKKL
ncbi:hypothetical protein [Caudoviricetes sp.]|nr:hypothetical protein [Caudoviricetes sp.]